MVNTMANKPDMVIKLLMIKDLIKSAILTSTNI